ncbi:MAG: metallophosphoesterase [Nannocystaceae bacterium]
MMNGGSNSLVITSMLAVGSCNDPETTPTTAGVETKLDVGSSKVDVGSKTLEVVQTPTPTSFLAISDVHYGKNAECCDYDEKSRGAYETCETCLDLWTQAQDQAKALIKADEPGFIVYLGDLPAHNESRANRTSEFGTVLDGLSDLVSGHPAIRLVYVPGNNDAVDGDYCGFTSRIHEYEKEYSKKTPFDYAKAPTDWPVINGANDIIDSKHLAQGYYSVYPLGQGAKLRLIALNTVMFTDSYMAKGNCRGKEQNPQQTQTQDQMAWLDQQLSDAENAKHKVILAMHVPPGLDGHDDTPTHMWSTELTYENENHEVEGLLDAFLGMVADAQQQRTIVGILTAHTHENGIRRLFSCDDPSKFTALGVSVAAITTDHGNKPSMKRFRYDSTSFALLDDETYYAASSTQGGWAAGQSFKFSGSYPCTKCPAGASMHDRIATIGDADTIVDDMLKVLTVRPGEVSKKHMYEQALDVCCGSKCDPGGLR